MAKKNHSPLSGRGSPVEHGGGYSWVNSWAHGGSQMWGPASPSRRKKLKKIDRLPAIIYLAALGGTFLYVTITCLIELFR